MLVLHHMEEKSGKYWSGQVSNMVALKSTRFGVIDRMDHQQVEMSESVEIWVVRMVTGMTSCMMLTGSAEETVEMICN